MELPSISQQKALAYAPKPIAAISFLSCSYVSYHLLIERPDKRKRMYHRLVLAMNTCLQAEALVFFWGSWAVPKGTPNYMAARGTMATCTAQGFLSLYLVMTVAYYYASLSIFSYVAFANNFQEVKYLWIEKWIHIGACLPSALAVFIMLNENINPFISGCFITRAPLGCGNSPEMPCQRGSNNILLYSAILGLGQIVLYFIIPPVALFSIRRLVKNAPRDKKITSVQHIIESAQKRMLHDVEVQIALYLVSFWLTYVLGVFNAVYRNVTGEIMFNSLLAGQCLLSSQGLINMLIYFKLQKKKSSAATAVCAPVPSVHSKNEVPLASPNTPKHSSVPSNLNHKDSNKSPLEDSGICLPILYSQAWISFRSAFHPLTFSIFDGLPSESSHWVQFHISSVSDDGDNNDCASHDKNVIGIMDADSYDCLKIESNEENQWGEDVEDPHELYEEGQDDGANAINPDLLKPCKAKREGGERSQEQSTSGCKVLNSVNCSGLSKVTEDDLDVEHDQSRLPRTSKTIQNENRAIDPNRSANPGSLEGNEITVFDCSSTISSLTMLSHPSRPAALPVPFSAAAHQAFCISTDITFLGSSSNGFSASYHRPLSSDQGNNYVDFNHLPLGAFLCQPALAQENRETNPPPDAAYRDLAYHSFPDLATHDTVDQHSNEHFSSTVDGADISRTIDSRNISVGFRPDTSATRQSVRRENVEISSAGQPSAVPPIVLTLDLRGKNLDDAIIEVSLFFESIQLGALSSDTTHSRPWWREDSQVFATIIIGPESSSTPGIALRTAIQKVLQRRRMSFVLEQGGEAFQVDVSSGLNFSNFRFAAGRAATALNGEELNQPSLLNRDMEIINTGNTNPGNQPRGEEIIHHRSSDPISPNLTPQSLLPPFLIGHTNAPGREFFPVNTFNDMVNPESTLNANYPPSLRTLLHQNMTESYQRIGTNQFSPYFNNYWQPSGEHLQPLQADPRMSEPSTPNLTENRRIQFGSERQKSLREIESQEELFRRVAAQSALEEFQRDELKIEEELLKMVAAESIREQEPNQNESEEKYDQDNDSPVGLSVQMADTNEDEK